MSATLPRPARAPVLSALIGIVALVAGVLYATLPPSPDQWFLGYTGWRVTEGAVPYRDFADGNWPAAHWLHATSVLLLGNTPYTWRVFDYALMLVAVGFAASTVRDLWGPAAGRWMLGLYPALYVVLGRWFAGERDIVGAHVLFIATWAYWRGLARGRIAWQAGTGALLALAAMVKPTFALFGPLLAVHALLAGRALGPLRQRLLQVGAAGVASIAAAAALLAALFLEGTRPAEFWEMAVQSVLVRYGNDTVSGGEMWRILATNVTRSWHWIAAGAATGLVARLARGGPRSLAGNLLFPTLWVAGLAAFVVQGQALGYTLGPVYAATIPILCSGLGLLAVPHGAPWRKAALVGVLLAVPVLGTAKKWAGEFGSSFAWLTGRIDLSAHRGRFNAGDGLTAAQADSLSAELAREVAPGGSVLVWGRANAINFLSRRPQPSRFHHNVTIMRRYLPAELSARWNGWFVEEVRARAPEFCLVNEGELDETAPAPASIPFLRAYLAEHYVAVRRMGDSVLYARNRPATEEVSGSSGPHAAAVRPSH